MFISSGEHARFEEAIFQAFPIGNSPKLAWEEKTTFACQAKKLLTDRRWPEVIGYRLVDGELDPSLSVWMAFIPMDVFQYYLPSHLIFASILLKAGPESLMYPMQVMQAMILAPSDDEAQIREIDDELYMEALVADNKENRAALYSRMTKEQRACVAQYLGLYLDHKRPDFSERGVDFFMQNIGYWQNSSLPVSRP